MIFYLSKIMWFLFNPFNLIIFFIIFGYCFNLFSLKILSNISYFLSLFIFLFSALIPTGSYLNYLLEKKFHSSNIYHDSIDGILILGGGLNLYLTNEHKQISLNGAAERLTESVILINRYPDAKIVEIDDVMKQNSINEYRLNLFDRHRTKREYVRAKPKEK